MSSNTYVLVDPSDFNVGFGNASKADVSTGVDALQPMVTDVYERVKMNRMRGNRFAVELWIDFGVFA
eukprot:CAMPEP_0194047808 /NCGR_PEP_ID=MMETSP0009_2-20130614/25594_1 /TAXON_ID=210454 /ORGANISM="Grammatophora oceanica, Strain CCMP 410" /LENGTH=66 /DNA_ID=CAMNT_0038693523 /DNA_START=233 /DNA_END=433 /DNA_ORIENTATION=-